MSQLKLTLGPGAGFGATALVLKGNNQAALVQIFTGTNPVPGAVFASVAYGQPFGVAPAAIVLAPSNAQAIDAGAYPDYSTITAAGFDMFVTKGLPASGTLLVLGVITCLDD